MSPRSIASFEAIGLGLDLLPVLLREPGDALLALLPRVGLAPLFLGLGRVLFAAPVLAEDLALFGRRQLDSLLLCAHHLLHRCDHPVQVIDPVGEQLVLRPELMQFVGIGIVEQGRYPLE
ncbi:hypothetical protein V525_07000 [Gordonia alkanivorans CGMCC 6845]|uniref:Uncharacterized protein n=1 Tax=Gordonia alkanivorans CGMCC 6845 TaxID=1423140 RepID=W9DGQ6_9ACTN|nr:hypothetical protein V525_07000 [Gordonia alkanivorans CGMCC 6845]